MNKRQIVGVLLLLFAALAFAAVKALTPASGDARKVPLGYAVETTPASTTGAVTNNKPTIRPEVVTEANTLRLTGTIVADQKSEVASTANGIVQEVKINNGSLVEKGDPLVIVDPKDAENSLKEGLAGVAELRAALGWEEGQRKFNVDDQADVKSAKASLDLAKSNFDRYDNLLRNGAISKSAYDQARMQYDTAKEQHRMAAQRARQLYQSLQTALARVDILKKMVDDTVIRAPFSGWIEAKYVAEGERVSTSPMGAGSKVVSVVKVDPLRLVLTVPQQYAATVTPGQKVTFTIETFPDKTFSGDVKYIAPSVDSVSRSLSVEVLVANTDRVLRPGFFAAANLTLPGKTQKLTLPTSAVVQSNESAKVYVVHDDATIEKVVEIDKTEGDRVFIKSGITADDAVLAKPETGDAEKAAS